MERDCEAARRELQEWIQARADTDRAVDGQGRPLTHRERRPSPRSPTAPPSATSPPCASSTASPPSPSRTTGGSRLSDGGRALPHPAPRPRRNGGDPRAAARAAARLPRAVAAACACRHPRRHPRRRGGSAAPLRDAALLGLGSLADAAGDAEAELAIRAFGSLADARHGADEPVEPPRLQRDDEGDGEKQQPPAERGDENPRVVVPVAPEPVVEQRRYDACLQKAHATDCDTERM